MSIDGLGKELKGVLALKQTTSSDGKEASSEQLTFRGPIAEADLSPLHGRANAAFGDAVGGLNSLMLQKGEQVVPGGEQAPRHARDVRIRFLQSPKKKYGVWVFHERLTKDTLFRIRQDYVEPKISMLEGKISGLRKNRESADGREKRRLEKEIASQEEVVADVREFSKRIKFISEERVYIPRIDDGVLLNMAPLWELIPSWQAEPKKAWGELESGKYDWAYQAMDHWPERVREKCKTNKSYAIATGALSYIKNPRRGNEDERRGKECPGKIQDVVERTVARLRDHPVRIAGQR
jgi:hypothetical protein